MRIAYLLTSLGIGGAERQAVSLAERMCGRGHAVHVLVLIGPTDQAWRADVEVTYLNVRKTPGRVLVGARRALQILQDFRPDILHCHTFHANVFGRLLRLALPELQVISTIHNTYEGPWHRMLAYRASSPLCTRTFAVCQAAAYEAMRRGAVAQGACGVITNGIDAHEFLPDPERRRRMRAEFTAGVDFVWITAGRIVPAKDYPGLLRAFALLREHSLQTQLWIAGEGSGDYVKRMQALSKELGLAGAVRWLGVRRDMPAVLDAGDGFVLGSAWEGLPLALGEAMAMEKACVATDVGGVPEILGDYGRLVQAGDPRALAEGMLRLMAETADARAHMGHSARLRIQERFSLDAKATDWQSVYESLVSQPSR